MSRKTSAYARRRAHRQVGALVNPLHVIEGQQRVADHAPGQAIGWGLRARLSFDAALKGAATKEDVCTLIAVQAIVASFIVGGVGSDYADIARASKAAIDALQIRHARGSSAINYQERTAITNLLQLHDALMEVATVKMVEQAHAHAVVNIKVLMKETE